MNHGYDYDSFVGYTESGCKLKLSEVNRNVFSNARNKQGKSSYVIANEIADKQNEYVASEKD
jgi:hypothetical protein